MPPQAGLRRARNCAATIGFSKCFIDVVEWYRESEFRLADEVELGSLLFNI